MFEKEDEDNFKLKIEIGTPRRVEATAEARRPILPRVLPQSDEHLPNPHNGFKAVGFSGRVIFHCAYAVLLFSFWGVVDADPLPRARRRNLTSLSCHVRGLRRSHLRPRRRWCDGVVPGEARGSWAPCHLTR